MQFKIQWYGNVMVEIYSVYKGLHDLILGLVSLAACLAVNSG